MSEFKIFVLKVYILFVMRAFFSFVRRHARTRQCYFAYCQINIKQEMTKEKVQFSYVLNSEDDFNIKELLEFALESKVAFVQPIDQTLFYELVCKFSTRYIIIIPSLGVITVIFVVV